MSRSLLIHAHVLFHWLRGVMSQSGLPYKKPHSHTDEQTSQDSLTERKTAQRRDRLHKQLSKPLEISTSERGNISSCAEHSTHCLSPAWRSENHEIFLTNNSQCPCVSRRQLDFKFQVVTFCLSFISSQGKGAESFVWKLITKVGSQHHQPVEEK